MQQQWFHTLRSNFAIRFVSTRASARFAAVVVADELLEVVVLNLWNKYYRATVPSMEPKVESCERTLAFVGSKTRPMLVVHDYVRTRAPTTFDWLLHTLNKMEFVYRLARFGLLLVLGVLALRALFATAAQVKTNDRSNPNEVATATTSLKPPDKGQIPVAFLISDGAVVIDFCGPWEVFQDAMIPSSREMPFRLYTVAETKKPIRTSGGMQIVPDYTIKNAPPPKVIVIPAQSEPSSADSRGTGTVRSVSRTSSTLPVVRLTCATSPSIGCA